MMVITWERDMPLPSLANQREHWRKRHARSAVQKRITLAECIAKGATKDLYPASVTLVRRGPRKLDSDNLQGAFKAVRDAIAEAFGVDDGDDGITWVYQQDVGRWNTGARVHVEARQKNSLELEKTRKLLAGRARMLAAKALSRAPTATRKRSAKGLKRMEVGNG